LTTVLSRSFGQLALPTAASVVAVAGVLLLEPGRWPATLPALLVLALAAARIASLAGVAELQRLRRQSAALERIVRLAADGVVLLDGSGRVRLWNPAMERATGVPASDALGRHYDDLLAGLDFGGTHATLDRLLAAAGPDIPHASAEVLVRTTEGVEHWLRCDHSLELGGKALSADVVTVHDVTRLREVERARADFVAAVSHELRTPITPIKGYVELLRAKGDSMSAELRQDVLATVAERTNHMARLIEDLLLASRISAEGPGAVVLGLQLGSTDLVEAARRAAADYLRDPTSRLELELPAEPVEVRADPLRLSQVLANLLSNAHKYSPLEAPIHLRLWRDGRWARVSVIDQGHGIPDEELERIFDKFHRVEDPMTMAAGGTGLGLYIARELARAMGGEVEASSAPQLGSTFTVRLPLDRQATRAATRSS
jgi:PAS domain S-box-containing protein